MFMDNDQFPFEIGKGIRLNEGSDVSIIATGHLVWKAVEAARKLEDEGISVDLINIHTIKPLDEDLILDSVGKSGCVVTCEEHNKIGGLGDSIAHLCAVNNPTPQEYVAVDDTFGESGKVDQLLEKYGLNEQNIIKAVKKVIKRK